MYIGGIIAVLRFFLFKCAEQWADVAVRREVKGDRRRWQVRSSLFPACPADTLAYSAIELRAVL